MLKKIIMCSSLLLFECVNGGFGMMRGANIMKSLSLKSVGDAGFYPRFLSSLNKESLKTSSTTVSKVSRVAFFNASDNVLDQAQTLSDDGRSLNFSQIMAGDSINTLRSLRLKSGIEIESIKAGIECYFFNNDVSSFSGDKSYDDFLQSILLNPVGEQYV